MSRTLLAVALLAVIGFGACKKDDDDDPTIPSNYINKGRIKYQNNSGDLYDIYMDNTRYGSLYGGDTVSFPNIATGAHRVRALQVEHISGTPTERAMVVNVYKDSTTTFVFP